jgi:hypothetical protein
MLSPHSPRCVNLSGRAGRGKPPFSLQLIKLELSADYSRLLISREEAAKAID